MMEKPYITRVALKKQPEGSYLSALPVVRHLAQMEYLPIDHNITFFVGENGTGKSTLLEAVAVCAGFNPEGGTRNFSFSSKETHSKLYESIRLSRLRTARDGFFLRAESFYNVASEIDRLDAIAPLYASYGGRSLHEQSHGESFLSLVRSRFGAEGLYILDEPEAALSPVNQMALFVEIHHLAQEGAQFLIATHSPILMAVPGADIYELSEKGISRVPYRMTEHYQMTRRFLEDPDRVIRYLLPEEPDSEPPA